MALIVEVMDARGGSVKARVRLDALPLSVGRGYDNDLILDDAYVDARHARIHMRADGTVEVEDLGSINGLVAAGGTERVPRVAAQPGTQVRVGRTILRFRDPSDPVPAAVPEAVHGTVLFDRMLMSPLARAGVCGAAIAIVTLYTWLASYERDSGSTAAAVGVGFTLVAALWCGTWAVASRLVIHRFSFSGHFTIASAVTVALMLYTSVAGWWTFLFPDNLLAEPVGIGVFLALATASIALHLRLSSTMNRLRRWRAAAITVGALTLMVGLVAYAGRDMFTDVPEFSGVLKPVSGRLLPASDVVDFRDVVAELKAEADALVGQGL